MAAIHGMCAARAPFAHPPRQAALTSRSGPAVADHYAHRVRRLPLLPQVLCAAVAVINIMDLVPPLGRENGVRALRTRSPRSALALALHA
jgi:hypothetical protein